MGAQGLTGGSIMEKQRNIYYEKGITLMEFEEIEAKMREILAMNEVT